MRNKNSRAKLALYHMPHCPYCVATRRVINKLGLEIELRNTLTNPAYRQELINQGGKHQVPCLRIENAEGDVTWLYESQDIIHYLRQVDEGPADAA